MVNHANKHAGQTREDTNGSPSAGYLRGKWNAFKPTDDKQHPDLKHYCLS